MARRHKRRRGNISASATDQRTRDSEKNDENKISFSFAALDFNHPKFRIPEEYRVDFLYALVTDALARYSAFTEKEFRKENRRDHRHRIDFTKSSCREGFGLPAEDLNQDAWQIAVCSGRPQHPKNKWRVYGYLVESVFYIVWFDTQHDMFP